MCFSNAWVQARLCLLRRFLVLRIGNGWLTGRCNIWNTMPSEWHTRKSRKSDQHVQTLDIIRRTDNQQNPTLSSTRGKWETSLWCCGGWICWRSIRKMLPRVVREFKLCAEGCLSTWGKILHGNVVFRHMYRYYFRLLLMNLWPFRDATQY